MQATLLLLLRDGCPLAAVLPFFSTDAATTVVVDVDVGGGGVVTPTTAAA